jgi:hypothetical protein
MSGSLVSSAGLRDSDLHIDGTTLRLPWSIEVYNPPLQTLTPTGSGRRRVDIPYRGAGLPDHAEVFDWLLRWDIDDQYATELAFLEALRVNPSTHTLCYWKKYLARYTAKTAQTVFYLPRVDAYTQSYSGKTGSDYKAVVKVDNVAIATVNYPGAVTSATSVTAGQVSISTVSTTHPESGEELSLFKFGTAPGRGAIVTVEFHPLFNCAVDKLETSPFEKTGREDKALYLAEVN